VLVVTQAEHSFILLAGLVRVERCDDSFVQKFDYSARGRTIQTV
jgi:hypothetical protein